MLLVLIPQPVLEGLLHIFLIDDGIVLHLVQVRPRLLVRQFHHIRLIEPAQHLRRDFIFALYALEALLKGHIKFIKFRLTLHKDHPRKIVELCKAAARHALLQSILQRQPLAHRDMKPLCLTYLKKRIKHILSPISVPHLIFQCQKRRAISSRFHVWKSSGHCSLRCCFQFRI